MGNPEYDGRVWFLDYLRAFIVFLVVLYHAGWVYEQSADLPHRERTQCLFDTGGGPACGEASLQLGNVLLFPFTLRILPYGKDGIHYFDWRRRLGVELRGAQKIFAHIWM